MDTRYLGSSEVGIVRLSPDEEEILQAASAELHRDVKDLSHAEAFEAFATAAPEIAERTPRLQEMLGNLATHTSFKTMVLELPAPNPADLPETPVRYLTPEENPVLPPAVTRGLVLGMMDVSPFGYTSQQSNNVINNVIAIKAQTEKGVKGASANAKDQLGLHTEDASYNLGGGILANGHELAHDLDLSPDWLTIQFLRNPDAVPTFVSVPDLDKLSDTSRELLQQPFFHNATNPGQQEDGNNDIDVRLSVIYDDNFIRANIDGLRVTNGDHAEEAQVALDELRSLMAESTVNLPSQPGNIILIDNNRVAHGRAKPQPHQLPRWDGRDRWQQRVVAYDDLRNRADFMVKPSIVEPKLFLARVALLGSA